MPDQTDPQATDSQTTPSPSPAPAPAPQPAQPSEDELMAERGFRKVRGAWSR